MLTDEALSTINPDEKIDTGLQYLILSGPDKGTVRTVWLRGDGKQTAYVERAGNGSHESATLLNPLVGAGDVVIGLGAFEGVDPGLPFAVRSTSTVDGQRVVHTMDQEGGDITLTRWVLSAQTAESRKAYKALEAETEKALDTVLEGFLTRDWSDHAQQFLSDVGLENTPVPAVSEVKVTLELQFSDISQSVRRDVYKVSDGILQHRQLQAIQTVRVTLPKSPCRCTEVTGSDIRAAMGDRLQVDAYLSNIEIVRTTCIYCS